MRIHYFKVFCHLSVFQHVKRIALLLLSTVLMPSTGQAIKQLMYTHTLYACSQPHYYETDSTYLIRAAGVITGQRCELSFLESAWSEANLEHPCHSLCVKTYNFSMSSCDVRMIYHDGLGDPNPRAFDCHTFPPRLWCTSKTDLKIEFVELRKYKGEPYDVTLEIKPYCGRGLTTSSATFVPSGDSYIERYRREEKRQRDTVIITGSLVSTVSFLLVIFWIVYCCWKRRNTNEESSTPSTTAQSTAVKAPHNAFAANPGRSRPGMMAEDNKNWYLMSQRDHLPGYQPPSFNNCLRNDVDVRYTEMPCASADPNLHLGPQQRMSPAKESRYREDHFFDQPLHSSQHPYDADEEVAFTNQHSLCPPPLPPRPNILHYQPKQYFV